MQKAYLSLSSLLVLLFISCASTPSPVATSTQLRTAPEAIGMLTRDLLLVLPVPLRIGIDDFPLTGGRRIALGRYLTDLFVSSLSRQAGGAVTPVERKQLDAALSESEYSLNQLISDPQRFSQVGQFIPAQALATGSITILEDRVSLSVRVFSVTNGEILAAGTVELERDANIERLVPQI